MAGPWQRRRGTRREHRAQGGATGWDLPHGGDRTPVQGLSSLGRADPPLEGLISPGRADLPSDLS